MIPLRTRGWSPGVPATDREGPAAMVTLAALLLLGAAAVTSAAPPDGDEERARALAAAKLTFRAYVFAGEDFPSCDFEQPDRVKDLIGPFSIKPTFYDRGFRPATSAAAAGPYGAVIEVTSEAGVTLRREATLYRTPTRVDPGWHFDAAAPHEAARRLGLDAAAVRRQAEVITGELKGRAFADLAHDPRVARLLAGLSLAQPGDGGDVKQDDSFTRERRWWDALKRRLADMDRPKK
jgi:hypothetical protein